MLQIGIGRAGKPDNPGQLGLCQFGLPARFEEGCSHRRSSRCVLWEHYMLSLGNLSTEILSAKVSNRNPGEGT